MREDWSATKLGNLIAKRDDFTPVVADGEYVILGVQRSGWGFVEREPIRGSDMKFTKLMQVEEDDLVYRTITAFEAPSAVVGPNQAGRFVTPQTFPVFRIDGTQLLPAYMKLLTTSKTFHQEMSKRCTGSVLRRKTLSVGAFLSIPIALPPLAEQRRIVDLIRALDETIAASEEVVKAAQSSASSLQNEIIDSMTGDDKVLLGKIATVKRGATWGKSQESDKPSTTHEPVVGIAVTSGSGNLDLSKMKYVSDLKESVTRLSPRDILMVMSNGNPDRIGNVYLVDDRLNGMPFSAFQMAIKDVVPEVDPKFLFYVLASPRSQSHFTDMTAGSTGLRNLNLSKVNSFELHVPSTKRQAEAVEILDIAYEAITTARELVEVLRATRSNMLTALLSGEHEIPDSYDTVMEVAA